MTDETNGKRAVKDMIHRMVDSADLFVPVIFNLADLEDYLLNTAANSESAATVDEEYCRAWLDNNRESLKDACLDALWEQIEHLLHSGSD